MHKSRLSRREADCLVALFPRAPAASVLESREPGGLGRPAAREAGRTPRGLGLCLGFRAASEVSCSEEWVSGWKLQEGSSAVKREGAPVRRHVPPQLPY